MLNERTEGLLGAVERALSFLGMARCVLRAGLGCGAIVFCLYGDATHGGEAGERGHGGDGSGDGGNEGAYKWEVHGGPFGITSCVVNHYTVLLILSFAACLLPESCSCERVRSHNGKVRGYRSCRTAMECPSEKLHVGRESCCQRVGPLFVPVLGICFTPSAR